MHTAVTHLQMVADTSHHSLTCQTRSEKAHQTAWSVSQTVVLGTQGILVLAAEVAYREVLQLQRYKEHVWRVLQHLAPPGLN